MPSNDVGIEEIIPAVVQVVALRQGFLGNLSSAWTGSGTIVHPKGVIVTNCHVADPRSMGMPSPPADKLGIAITDRSDQPPVLTYTAQIVAKSPQMDLAVLRIDARVDGKSITRMKLPYVELGDSDGLELGDMMRIFGYPGIGGETITFTSGSVSGFTQQKDLVKGRAWIKTDATIAGGNSGGTAVDNDGNIVGIPTQAAAGTGITPVDARPVVDTNRDGRVDQRDTPMAIGGFINGLRPVNLVKPMLKKIGMDVSGSSSTKSRSTSSKSKTTGSKTTRSKTTGSKTTGSKTTGSKTTGSNTTSRTRAGGLKPLGGSSRSAKKVKATSPTVKDLVFSDTVTEQGLPINPSAILSGGQKRIFASFEFDGFRNGTKWGQVWTVDGKPVLQDEGKWEDGPRGRKTLALASRRALPDGQYHLIITAKGEILAEGQVSLGRLSEDADTQVSGQIIDRDSNRGVSDALVIALNPGVRTADFIKKQRQDMAYTSTKTDRYGRYTFPKQLPKGKAYSLVVVARGYKDLAVESALRVSPHAPEKAQIQPVPMIREE